MDLISLPAEKTENRFRLTIAAIKRARALRRGALPLIKSKAKKMTSIAFEEIVTGHINILSGADAVKAEEKAKSLTHQSMMDEAKQKASFPEEMTKIEKDLQVYLRDKAETADEDTT